jgi:hypothetical protein
VKYLVIIYGNEELWSSFPADELQKHIDEQDAYNTEYMKTGELLGAYGTADVAQAQTVSVRDGATVVTDGPYIETKEYIGSFYILDVDSHERAIELAAKIPYASVGCVEVWPLMHEAGDVM